MVFISITEYLAIEGHLLGAYKIVIIVWVNDWVVVNTAIVFTVPEVYCQLKESRNNNWVHQKHNYRFFVSAVKETDNTTRECIQGNLSDTEV